jgi:hypothetical protein
VDPCGNKTSTNRRRANRIRFSWQRRVKKRGRRDSADHGQETTPPRRRLRSRDSARRRKAGTKGARIAETAIGSRRDELCKSARSRLTDFRRTGLREQHLPRRPRVPQQRATEESQNKRRANRGRRDWVETRRTLQAPARSPLADFPRQGQENGPAPAHAVPLEDRLTARSRFGPGIFLPGCRAESSYAYFC